MKLVIVESPAKAQTIRGYLGKDFRVEASVGHVRDLPTPSALPPSMKKGPYSRFAVNVDDNFKPYYMVSPERKKQVAELRKALKEADELYLATDEDREGEAIAWHLKEILRPKVPVKRMVFHEITEEAIQGSLETTRDIDRNLVDAQETRRILDRLFGYEVSPLLWRKVAPSLSAGRVQSVATRLVVDREKLRMAHVSAEYWSLTANVESGLKQGEPQNFDVKIVALGERAVAVTSDFTSEGVLTDKAIKAGAVVLDEKLTKKIADKLEGVFGTISSVTQRPYRRRPAAPFTTSTLQQEASRKLKWNASTTMRMAQSLYEGGYITYMRTDSTALSSQALGAARSAVRNQFGGDAIPSEPRVYSKKAKGAQEAHEAIRPSGDQFRTPQQVSGSLSAQQLVLYDLIYKRTLASQMNDAVGYTATVRVQLPLKEQVLEHKVAYGSTSGTVITEPGFRRLYQETKDALKDKRGGAELPKVQEGERIAVKETVVEDHHTQPPGRFTEATLVKAMEDLGIGRPSTYASTIQTIGDRGYIMHRGQYLVPTWLALSVTRLLMENLNELVDYQFTASMESDLDRIAAGEQAGAEWLNSFYFGEAGKKVVKELEKMEDADKPETTIESHGLRGSVETLGDIDAREMNSVSVAPGVVLRNGRYGPYLQTDQGKRASVPPTVAPDEMTEELVKELLEVAEAEGRELGVYPPTGNMMVLKTGRFGPYITEVLPDGSEQKPKTASLLSTMSITSVTFEEALELMSLPRELGADPSSGEVITVQNGPYGPYLRKGKDTRQLPSEEMVLTVTLEEALELFSKPKYGRRTGSASNLRELGSDPVTKKKVTVKDGRFGPYVTDGTTNATIPRSETVEDLTPERAYTLLADKRDKAPVKRTVRKGTARKAAARRTSTSKTSKK